MDLEKLLVRQLKHHKLELDSPPGIQQWKDFLERVNNTYIEANQERYLLERSLELSSNELLSLNERLENAQHIAHLGYWLYDKHEDQLIWSKEFCYLFGIESGKPTPSYEEFLELIHPKDRMAIEDIIEKAFSQSQNFEHEVRIQNNNEYRWYLLIGHVSDETLGEYQLSGVIMDITSRKQAEEQVFLLHQQLLVSARQAGMADVASSVLHNVGNVLNSANVSMGLIKESLDNACYEKLFSVINHIKENLPSNPNYLIDDQKGKLIPQYLICLAEFLEKNHGTIVSEIDNLNKNLEHIIEIVAMQQKLGGISGHNEKIFLPEILDLSLQMAGCYFEEKNLQIIKKYNENLFVTTDKTKLLQVLVNLIQNAKDSVKKVQSQHVGNIIIEIDKKMSDQATITIKDNGIGIPSENITKIFSFGFTTKQNGHGFGLHSSALAANEIGGTLVANSKGVNQGAIFTLTLPIKHLMNKGKANETIARFTHSSN
jgi:PAS domain S-box-containing protein